METGYKPVLETYVRKVNKLVHLHAIDLCIGSELVNSSGEIVKIESIFRESLKDDTETVYNFKDDEWHTYFVGKSEVWVHNSMCQPKDVPDGMGQYKDKKGHHPMAKKAFEGAEGYDPNEAISISSEKLLNDFDVKHSTITGKQASLYREFYKTGKTLTLEEMKKIEIEAMVQSGVPKEYATSTVNAAIQQLKDSGITAPTKIPWGK